MERTTKKQAEQIFKNEILPSLNKNDKPQIRMEWNNFVDALCKNGQITQTKYNNWTHPKFVK